jgi:hypothetical protein
LPVFAGENSEDFAQSLSRNDDIGIYQQLYCRAGTRKTIEIIQALGINQNVTVERKPHRL